MRKKSTFIKFQITTLIFKEVNSTFFLMTRLADCTHKCRSEAEERFEHTQVKFPSASTWRSLQLPSAQRSRSKLDFKTRKPLSVNNYHSNHLILCIKIVHNLHKRKQTCHTQKNKKKEIPCKVQNSSQSFNFH